MRKLIQLGVTFLTFAGFSMALGTSNQTVTYTTKTTTYKVTTTADALPTLAVTRLVQVAVDLPMPEGTRNNGKESVDLPMPEGTRNNGKENVDLPMPEGTRNTGKLS